ncbi:MAG: hypothetical protein JO014_05475 [Metakosakonia sp.]|nr:hypothetical protein [Phytobacter sp.]MBV8872166.1 hypothetical protein [Phytobacter sp.]
MRIPRLWLFNLKIVLTLNNGYPLIQGEYYPGCCWRNDNSYHSRSVIMQKRGFLIILLIRKMLTGLFSGAQALFGSLEEVAAMVTYLADPQGDITGGVFTIAGGLNL